MRSTQGCLRAGLGSVVGEFLVSQAIGVSFQREDFRMVDESVNHRRGNDRIAEDLTPAGAGPSAMQ